MKQGRDSSLEQNARMMDLDFIEACCLATSTVAVHLAAALRKLGCPNRRALAHWLSFGVGQSS